MAAARVLFIAGASGYLIVGCAHFLASVTDDVRPRFIVPVSNETRAAMAATPMALAKRSTNTWRAWIGFNLSHSLGLVSFGLVCMLLAANGFELHVVSVGFLMPLAIAISLLYLVLSIRYWFWAPAFGAALASGCFIASYAIARAS